jgi:VIT1/CCC1 family predicted Fe2+/Mn2+ transporter
MDARTKFASLAAYVVLIVLLLMAFGFTIAYIQGEPFQLPFKL